MTVEIQGLDRLNAVFKNMPNEMRPYVLRAIATKPAQRAALRARQLQPIGNSGVTARTIGIRRVKNTSQPFVEVGYRGRSLGHIFASRDRITRFKRGTIKGFPWIFKRAGQELGDSMRKEMNVDLTKVFVRGFKKYGF